MSAKRELLKVINRTPESLPVDDEVEAAPFLEPTNGYAPEVGTLVSDARREPVTWIWHPWIAVGKITVIDGDPGLGKSTLTYDLAARVSRGDVMPDEDAPPPERKPGGVVIVNSEDGLGDTIRPRLEAARAVLERVVHVSMVQDDEGRERVLTIADDLQHIEAAARRVDAKMVVIDPLMAHLGRDTNSFRDQDVRRELAPLADFADRARLAIVVVRHLNKMSGGNALYRGGGSIGIIGAARVGLMVGRDPEDDERVILAPTKNNLARMPRSLAFSLVGSPDDPDVSMVEWEGPVDLRAHDLLTSPPSKSKKEDAADWLMGKLAGGPLPSNELIEEGKHLGYTRRTLFRARDEIGVKAKPVGSPAHGGYWTWTLPTAEDNDAPF